jgi:hypothetical protein
MSSERKKTANRRNSRKSTGPRTAAGRSKASRNALRHGLAAMTHRLPLSSGEIERLAKAICGDDDNPALIAPARVIAENEVVLRGIRAQQVAVVERLRDKTAIPLVKRDNSLKLAKARSLESRRAWNEVVASFPIIIEKYKDQLPELVDGKVDVSADLLTEDFVLTHLYRLLPEEESEADESPP